MTKLLLVDDEVQIRQLLGLYLKQYSYQIEEATNGQEAVQLVGQKEYDLIILDVMMPVMDGWQALEEIRSWQMCPY